MYTIAFNPQGSEAIDSLVRYLENSRYFISPTSGLVVSEDPGIILAIAAALNRQNIPYAASPLPTGPWRRNLLYLGEDLAYSCWMCGRVTQTSGMCKNCTSVSLVENPFGCKVRVPAADIVHVWYATRFRSGKFFPGTEVEFTLEPPAPPPSLTPDPLIVMAATAIMKVGLLYNLGLRILDAYFAFGTEWKTPRADHNLMLLHERFPSYSVQPEVSILRAIANYPALLEEVGEYEWARILDSHKELVTSSLSSR